MEKIDILLWAVGAGFAVNFGIMKIIWTSMNQRFDKMEEKITDIDRRLCRLEGAFSTCDLKERKGI